MATRHARRQAMQRLLGAWRQSGERIGAFCIKRGIPVSTFFRWKRRFQAEPVTTAQRLPPSTLPAFLQIGTASTTGTFQYRFPDGGSLVLPCTLALPDVAALVRQLRGAHD